jgi:hypothetical protein
MSIQLVLSPPFPLLDAASHSADVATLLRHVMLPSHIVKTSSLPPLHLLVTFRPIASPLKSKLKH